LQKPSDITSNEFGAHYIKFFVLGWKNQLSTHSRVQVRGHQSAITRASPFWTGASHLGLDDTPACRLPVYNAPF